MNQANVAGPMLSGALLIAAFPVAPLVALLMHAMFTAYWLTWTHAIWMFPAWVIACTLVAGSLMLPLAGLGWIVDRLTKGLPSFRTWPNEDFVVSQAALLATFVFWCGSIAGGLIFVLWKAARHSFLTIS